MSQVEFPVLDLEPFFNGKENADVMLANQLKEVCETIGFFFLKVSLTAIINPVKKSTRNIVFKNLIIFIINNCYN